MNRLKLIFKGVLLWVTTFAVLIFIAGVESIYENGYFEYALFVCTLLCCACYKLISRREFDILTFSRWFDKLEEVE